MYTDEPSINKAYVPKLYLLPVSVTGIILKRYSEFLLKFTLQFKVGLSNVVTDIRETFCGYCWFDLILMLIFWMKHFVMLPVASLLWARQLAATNTIRVTVIQTWKTNFVLLHQIYRSSTSASRNFLHYPNLWLSENIPQDIWFVCRITLLFCTALPTLS